MFRYKARETSRSEAYLTVRRNDEGGAQRRRWVFSGSRATQKIFLLTDIQYSATIYTHKAFLRCPLV